MSVMGHWGLAVVIVCYILSAKEAAAQEMCEDAKHPIIILPGIMASQINATYNGFAAGSPCLGHRSMTTVWPPSAKLILPTGLGCWMYMVQTKFNYRNKRFNNNRGVKIIVEPGGPSGTEYGLWQSSYTNLTSYLTDHFNYTLGRNMFGAPFDWRLHISGMERAGQMTALATRIEGAVRRNCGKKAVVVGHSMGGLVTLALLHRNQAWTDQYIGGFISVSAPYGGTSDQAIAVRMGSVDFNIADWVKLPMARAATDVATTHPAEVAVAVANMQADTTTDQTSLDPDGVIAVPTDSESIEVQVPSSSHMRMRKPGRKITSVAADGPLDEIAVPQPPIIAAAAAVKEGVVAVKDKVSTVAKSNMNKLISNYVSGIFYKATVGLPGLSMLLPYASAYGSNRRIVVTERETYTASMMQQLMADIGDTVTNRAWPLVHELEPLLAKGQVPGVPVHCIYAVGKDTTLTWDFPNIRENKPLLSSVPLVTTGGDGTVSMQSLRQCYKITDSANITELGDYGHLEVLKNSDTLAELGKALSAILYLNTAGSGSLVDDAAAQPPAPAGSSIAEPVSSSIDSSVLAVLQSSAADIVVSPVQQLSSNTTAADETIIVLPTVQPVALANAVTDPAHPGVLLLPATTAVLLASNNTEPAEAVESVLARTQQTTADAQGADQQDTTWQNNNSSQVLQWPHGQAAVTGVLGGVTAGAGATQHNETSAQVHIMAPAVDNNGSTAEQHHLQGPLLNNYSSAEQPAAAASSGEASQQSNIDDLQTQQGNYSGLLHTVAYAANISNVSSVVVSSSAVVTPQSPKAEDTGHLTADSHPAAWQSASRNVTEPLHMNETSTGNSSPRSFGNLVSASANSSDLASNSRTVSGDASGRAANSIGISSVGRSFSVNSSVTTGSISGSSKISTDSTEGSSAAGNGDAAAANQTSTNLVSSLSIDALVGNEPWLVDAPLETGLNLSPAATVSTAILQ